MLFFLSFFVLCKCALVFRFEVNETIGAITVVAYRNKGTYGNVSLFFYAQNLEAQQGLDYNTSEMVRHTHYSRTTCKISDLDSVFELVLKSLSSFQSITQWLHHLNKD